VKAHTSVLIANVQGREVAALIKTQSATASPGVLRGALFLSHVGEHGLSWTALGLLGGLLDPGQRRAWLRATATVVGAHGVSVLAKRVVRRHRPSDPRILVGVATPSDWSFPSSHAASTTAAAVAYSRLLRRRWPLFSIPLMMGSRVILGVHYPSDVVSGALIGAAMGRWVARARAVRRS